ncbi:glycosyltransferase family 2 protein [Roseateles oligotrophus]|uniref:Glycosyltransferase family 2 protein n=1 Tax=Roseateles oligotrophus TaxID=1769250 RepID=A0ABT2YFN8_9BURK|nr:glycosyltransferase family 2 protein [Roseateles oligotrophus]MCV2368868.1 glycosyltransferase family 2 protein [Roseateles oligotrophus]
MDALQCIGGLASALTIPGSLYLSALSLAAAWPANGAAGKSKRQPLKIVVLVPAHNESSGLLRTLQSLRADLSGDSGSQASTRIVVVADNCDDDTAALARDFGVTVLERFDAAQRGKGHALQYAFERIQNADWFIIIDADTDVEPGFLQAMRAHMGAEVDALQCRYGVRDPLSSQRASLGDVALGAWNVLRPRGRSALGLSAGILGNGFALSRRTLQHLPYSARSIVEDVEYHQMMVQAGLRVHWVDDAQVRGDMPEGRAQAAQQRARWEGGRLRLLREHAGPLMGALLRGQWRALDPLMDLCLLPLAWHLALLLLGLGLAGSLLQAVAVAGLVTLSLHVGLALLLIRAGRAHLRALLTVPGYLLWKLSLLASIWRNARPNAKWVRSARRQN